MGSWGVAGVDLDNGSRAIKVNFDALDVGHSKTIGNGDKNLTSVSNGGNTDGLSGVSVLITIPKEMNEGVVLRVIDIKDMNRVDPLGSVKSKGENSSACVIVGVVVVVVGRDDDSLAEEIERLTRSAWFTTNLIGTLARVGASRCVDMRGSKIAITTGVVFCVKDHCWLVPENSLVGGGESPVPVSVALVGLNSDTAQGLTVVGT